MHRSNWKLWRVRRLVTTVQLAVSLTSMRNWLEPGDWKKELQAMPKSKKARRSGKCLFSALETDLNEWILESRENGYIVSRSAIRMRALEMSKEEKYRTPDSDNFRASSGWCNRFMNRHGLSLRQRTKISQKLPKDLDEKISSFQKIHHKQPEKTPIRTFWNRQHGRNSHDVWFAWKSYRQCTWRKNGFRANHWSRKNTFYGSAVMSRGWYKTPPCDYL